MNFSNELQKAIRDLGIPNSNAYDFSTEQGVVEYRESWRALESRADELVKDIVRSNARAGFAHQSKIAQKAMKHLEKWRRHAQATTVLWNRTWDWKAIKEETNGYDSFLGWLGVKTQRQAWIAKEERDIERLTERLSKTNAVLNREYELLLVELDSLAPE